MKSIISKSKKTSARAIVLSGYGLNCENETAFAFERVGISTDIMHINDLFAKPAMLRKAQILSVPGGFSFGDDTGAGLAYGNRLRNHLGEVLEHFFARDTLTIGICNGFQILTAAGILPGALMTNDTGRYLCRWVDVEVVGDSPWLNGIKHMSLPIAHGEGKYVADAESLSKLNSSGSVALRYVSGDMHKEYCLPVNPNGTMENIAAVGARNGRILGMMPHPERAQFFTQFPHWQRLQDEYIRNGNVAPYDGPGIEIFKNAARYFE